MITYTGPSGTTYDLIPESGEFPANLLEILESMHWGDRCLFLQFVAKTYQISHMSRRELVKELGGVGS